MSATSTLLSMIVSFAVLNVLFINHVGADCGCGFVANIGNASIPSLFTDLIETDFLHLSNVFKDTDWHPQEFNVTAAAGRGPYGMNYSLANVVSNPILNATDWTGPGELPGDPGLQLLVDGGIPPNGYVQIAEIDSAREDLRFGSFRAAMKLTLTPGTCASFFWYFNDSQEIDMEFLSSQFVPENKTYPVNLVLQSIESVRAGYNAAATGNYKIANLPFDPSDGFHEYRFDFVPGIVLFYADGVLLDTMETDAVPFMPGHLILTQWSNGNPLWSFGPPPVESTITVSYVKAYFNSSDPARQSDWALRCKDPTATGAVCAIPDQYGAPDPSINTSSGNSSAATYFFSDDKNKTENQTVYHKNGGLALKGDHVWIGSISSLALLSLVMAFL